MKLFLKQAIKVFSFLAICIAIVNCSDDEPIDIPSGPFEFKQNLSEYNFFEGDIKNLNPVDGIEKFEISTPLFSDHTIKDRFIQIPENTSIGYKATGIVDFPAGTIIIKNFSSYDDNGAVFRLETRLLVLDPYNDEWKVMVYLWNETQTDAEMHITGKTISINVKDEFGASLQTNYKVPNVNDCKRCHVKNAILTPIGPKIRALNFKPEGASQNQLTSWSNSGFITGLPSTDIPVLPNWLDDANFTLDERARAYLDVNCAHCHTEGGDAYNTGLFLEYEQTDSSKLGLYKIPVSAGPGSGTLTYDLVPGDADQSIIHFRLNSAEAGIAMPELAKSIVHQEGVELIRDWINSL